MRKDHKKTDKKKLPIYPVIDWNIHYVFRAEHEMFADVHTHGLIEHGMPELRSVLAINVDTMGGVLNNTAQRVIHGDFSLTGDISEDILADGYVCQLLRYPDENAVYILFPDENNLLPKDAMCQALYNRQVEFADILHREYLQDHDK